MATTKKPGKALVNWEEQFADMAKEASKGIDLPTAKWLSIKSGKLTYGGSDIPDNELRCVVLAHNYENQYYVGRYDANNPGSPVCYSFGLDSKHRDRAPHEAAPDKQNDSCENCPLNEYESDPNGGKGKACKNVLRLALIAESDLEDLDAAEIVYLKVPTTSVKNFNRYVADDLKKKMSPRPYWSVVTKLSVEPDENNAVRVQFTHEENIEDTGLFQPLKDMYEENMESVVFPYPVVERTAKPAKGKAAPKAGKFNKRR